MACHDSQSDAALKLADLDVVTAGMNNHNNKGENSSLELTHDFDDCDSANSFTPLPSIQNDYALEIKSFNNQWKRPYSQQLSTNVFKEQFDLIMDNQCDQTLLAEDELNYRYQQTHHHPRKSKHRMTVMETTTKALKPHQKVQLLFEIVKAANHPHRLQDAKDIFDFILYEIGSQ